MRKEGGRAACIAGLRAAFRSNALEVTEFGRLEFSSGIGWWLSVYVRSITYKRLNGPPQEIKSNVAPCST